MRDVCELLGVKKLNTTAYHPQCDGMVERLNRTLKTMLRKHVAKFHGQWDRLLPGVLWAYRNTPHKSTREKPSFLLFGIDLKSPTEAALLPPDSLDPTDLGSYLEELILSLSSARELAVASIQEAQKSYKTQYDKRGKVAKFRVGDWVFVHFSEEETGKRRKLSRPWYGPFRVITRQDPNLTVRKVYFPEDPPLTIHQLRVCPSPDMLPPGFYWYGAKRRSSGRTPSWLQKMLSATAGDSASRPAAEDSGSPQGPNFHEEEDVRPASGDGCRPDQSMDISLADGYSAETLDSDGSIQPGVTDKSIGGDSISCGSECDTMSPHTGSDYHDPVAREQESLDDLSVLPYAAADFTDTTPAASRYSLRDRSRRKQPLRLMFTTTRDEEQFGTNCPEGGSDVTEHRAN